MKCFLKTISFAVILFTPLLPFSCNKSDAVKDPEERLIGGGYLRLMFNVVNENGEDLLAKHPVFGKFNDLFRGTTIDYNGNKYDLLMLDMDDNKVHPGNHYLWGSVSYVQNFFASIYYTPSKISLNRCFIAFTFKVPKSKEDIETSFTINWGDGGRDILTFFVSYNDTIKWIDSGLYSATTEISPIVHTARWLLNGKDIPTEAVTKVGDPIFLFTIIK